MKFSPGCKCCTTFNPCNDCLPSWQDNLVIELPFASIPLVRTTSTGYTGCIWTPATGIQSHVLGKSSCLEFGSNPCAFADSIDCWVFVNVGCTPSGVQVTVTIDALSWSCGGSPRWIPWAYAVFNPADAGLGVDFTRTCQGDTRTYYKPCSTYGSSIGYSSTDFIGMTAICADPDDCLEFAINFAPFGLGVATVRVRSASGSCP